MSLTIMETVKDPTILSEKHIPAEFVDRRTQWETLAAYMKAAASDLGASVYVFGRPGTGKTALLRRMLNDYSASEGKMKTVYLDCSEKQSFCMLLDFLLTEMGAIQPEKSVGSKLTALRKTLTKSKVFIVIDEIDKLADGDKDRLLFNLYEGGAAGIVVIGHSSDFLNAVGDGLRSRLFAETVHFPHYSNEDLFDILRVRAEEALYPGTFDDSVLRYIAERVGGDARRAIQALRFGVIALSKKGLNKLNEECVATGLTEAIEGRAEYALNKLGQHHRLIYMTIKRDPSLISSRLYRAYSKSARLKAILPVAPRTFTAYLDRLIRDNLVRPERPHVQGRTRTFSIVEEKEVP